MQQFAYVWVSICQGLALLDEQHLRYSMTDLAGEKQGTPEVNMCICSKVLEMMAT